MCVCIVSFSLIIMHLFFLSEESLRLIFPVTVNCSAGVLKKYKKTLVATLQFNVLGFTSHHICLHRQVLSHPITVTETEEKNHNIECDVLLVSNSRAKIDFL